MHVAIAIAAGPVCEFKCSVVTNVEPDKIRGTELDDTQLWNVCVASTTIRIYALLLHIHSPHWGGGLNIIKESSRDVSVETWVMQLTFAMLRNGVFS